MSNKAATLAITLSYPGPAGEIITRPPETVSCLYQGSDTSVTDVPDAELTATSHPVPFGACGVGATLALIKNKTGQDLEMRLNGNPPSTTGTLVAGTKTIAFSVAATGNLRVVAGATNGGTPGILSARKSGGDVIVESWLGGVGLQVLDISDFTVYDDVGILPQIPVNALMVIAAPQLPVAGRLSSIELITTAHQVGEGTIESRVFFDPVP